MSLVERIKKLAIGQHLTIAALERDCGFGNGTIRKWDLQSPAVDRVLKVANRLGVSLDYLVTGNSEGISHDEELLIDLYRKLPIYDQRDSLDIIKMKVERCKSDGDSTKWIQDSGETA